MNPADLLKRLVEALAKLVGACDGDKMYSDDSGKALDEAERVVKEIRGELDDWEGKAFGLFKKPQG